MDLKTIRIVEDRTAGSRCDEGFLRVRRLQVQNEYTDGSTSVPYPCDVVSRPGSDAVVATLYRMRGGEPQVLLREAARAPIYLRKLKDFVHPDPREYLTIEEVVAGLVEADDGEGEKGMQRRAAIEAEEEVGAVADHETFLKIGDETFASPGTSDEKVYYCAGAVEFDEDARPRGDGTPMEEFSRIVVRPLDEAIEACRSGAIPDMKTEIALLRLADHLGYLPQLDLFADELPAALRERYGRLAVAAAPTETS